MVLTMKKIFRSFFSLALVFMATLIVGCSSGTSYNPPTTYSSEQIAAIAQITEPITSIKARFPELEALIADENRVFIGNFIHGPLGFTRQQMRYISEQLLPDDSKKADALAKEFFGHIVNIDVAASDQNYAIAQAQYQEALKDLDAFIDLIPTNDQG
jgi:photosystem II protein PsbQ